MKRYFLDKFNETLIQEVYANHSAYSILTDLQYYLPHLKSEIMSNVLVHGVMKNLYLDIVINDITNINKRNDISLNSLSRWYTHFEIDVNMNTIMNGDITDKKIYKYLNNEYSIYLETDVKKSIQDVSLLQNDFAKYFSKYYEEEVIQYCNEMRKKTDDLQTSKSVSKPFLEKSFINFCESISNIDLLEDATFTGVYNDVILFHSKNLESEIIENLALLPNDKKDDYLVYLLDKIKKTHHYNTEESTIDNWLKKYKVDFAQFPNFKNEDHSLALEHIDQEDFFSAIDKEDLFDIQIDFYCYASMVEAKKIVAFIESKLNNTKKENTNSKNPNQLTTNQAVILLDKLGFFSNEIIELLPNTKKAALISKLIGKDDKNIKTAIQNLELKPKDIKAGYQKDLDKVQQLLNSFD